MPTVVIPIGGQNVPIDLQDFASEETTRRIAEYSEQTATMLRQLIGQDAGDDAAQNRVQQLLAQLLQSSERGNREQQRSTVSMISRLGRGLDNTAGELINVGRQLQSMNTAELVNNVGSMVSNMLPGGFGRTAQMAVNGLTALVGLLERTAASFNTLRRAGAGFGNEMEQLRSAAATSGLQLDNFAALVLENGRTIKSLGATTTEGALRFSQMSDVFYQALEPFGNFGMNMTDINQLLLDEIEARRVTTGTVYRLGQNFGTLTQAVVENARRQEAMARITGQDMRERMAAQAQARDDSRVRAALIGASERMLQNFNSVSAGLSRFDPGGTITAAFGQAFATGFDPMAFAPEMMAVLGPGIQGLLREAQQNMDAMDPDQFSRWFESNLAAQFEAMRGNEDYMRQLTMMSHSTNQQMASSAQTLLTTLTQFQRIQEDRESQEALRGEGTPMGNLARMTHNIEQSISAALRETGGADFNDASRMQAQLDRFGASLSSYMATNSIQMLDRVSRVFDLQGTNLANQVLGNMRDFIQGLPTVGGRSLDGQEYSMSDFGNFFSNIYAALDDSAQSAIDFEIQNAQLSENRQTNLLIRELISLTAQNAGSQDEQIAVVNRVLDRFNDSTRLNERMLYNSGMTPSQWLLQHLNPQ
jgi:hypothetical protein